MGHENFDLNEGVEGGEIVAKSLSWLKEKVNNFEQDNSTFVAVMENYALWGASFAGVIASANLSIKLSQGNEYAAVGGLFAALAVAAAGLYKGMSMIIDRKISNEEQGNIRRFNESNSRLSDKE